MYSTAYNRVQHYGIYGLVIDKYTFTECATTAARRDFPLRHSLCVRRLQFYNEDSAHNRARAAVA